MLYTIENKTLKVSVDTLGAELQSIYSKKTETEYLWQGNEKYWKGRASNLFPVIGRLYGGKYTYDGNEYELGIHGFARKSEFTLAARTATKLSFTLKESEETLKDYPFRFTLTITYQIKENKLSCLYTVTNDDEKELIFTVGGHPGINVPFEKNDKFENYFLEFSENTKPVWHTLSGSFMSGKVRSYPLKKGVVMPLTHEILANDAIVLGKTSRKVTLKSKASKKSIEFEYPDFKYLGVWQAAAPDTPYVCLEPWSSLPSTDGKPDKLETKFDMSHLNPGESEQKIWMLTVVE
ncbi:MAG: aldose 1-epimerase family protein [Clostridia bacterium]|nr:aldose 1-epimerase family protein [Clostridia bacterium]